MCNSLISTTQCLDYNGQKYKIFIAHSEKVAGNLNPLYLLDANTQFSTVTEYENRRGDADILYVGIGYQDDVDIKQARTRDYTIPSPDEEFAEGGGAEAFYQFITTCVKPWIESHYSINAEQQTLAGHSHGGHFVMYTLLNHPKAFQRYLAASPSIWWGEGALLSDGDIKLDESVNKLTLMLGEYEEKIHPESNEKEASRVRRINANPKLRVRNIAESLLGSEQRCDFILCMGRRHPGVIKDYAQMANIIAAHSPQADGL
ncbi:alpha/beta hydrolase-fold protein [Serratia nevei]|uniref:alpha/beta hydrolase n=1 Tax=Serratia nevei TaxID=2703794 RepID=UPI00209CE907|nr:alpha/beta hydrolase-fold protein [Serratia nevei]MCP1104864.1 alpha/beta hydrolase-fold protein [Serratia nevei]